MLTTFWLALGYACNNRCSHCYATPKGFSSDWMSVSFAQEVMNTMREGGAKTCLLIGGEPTLYPDLIPILIEGSRIGLKMVIVSNGRRLKNGSFTHQLFQNGLDRAVISLEGADTHIHNKLTGRNSFSETIAGIKNGAEHGQVNTLTTICSANAHQIEDVIKTAYDCGAQKAILNCAIPVLDPQETQENTEIGLINPRELAQVVERVFISLSKQSISFQLNATFPLCLLDKDILTEALKLDWLSVGCHMYRGKGVVFDPNGDILPCTHFSEAPLVINTVGKTGEFLYKKKFWEFWQDEKSEAGKFREKLWRYPAKKCASCEYWGGCVGGCPLLWTHFDPQDFIIERR